MTQTVQYSRINGKHQNMKFHILILLERVDGVVHMTAPHTWVPPWRLNQIRNPLIFDILETLLDLETNSLLPTEVTNRRDDHNKSRVS